MSASVDLKIARKIVRYRQLGEEIKLRRSDALRVYRPQKNQTPFHKSLASERVVRGGNRSGKSIAAAAEFAAAVTGTCLRDHEGKVIPNKYPAKVALEAWVFGYDAMHIGKTIFKLLFLPGLFKTIIDEDDGELRTYDPGDKDRDRPETDIIPSRPLIEERFLEGESMDKAFSWDNKGERIFTVCRLKNGTLIRGWSSKGRCPMGDAVDIVWIDEDIEDPRHVGELQARLSDRRGRLFWSAFPLSNNDALMRMTERAEEQVNREFPDIFEIVLRYRDNPFIHPDEKRKRLEAWEHSGEIGSRDLGNYNQEEVLVYPSFAKSMHGIDPSTVADSRLPNYRVISKMLENNGQPPLDWTRFFILDPGHTQAACLFFAIPPPRQYGDFAVCYQEMYPKQWGASDIARGAREFMAGRNFEKFIIDMRAGRQRGMAGGETIARQFSIAFEADGLYSNSTGSSFQYGSDDVSGRIQAVRSWLQIRGNGTCKFLMWLPGCPNMVKEFGRYKKKIVKDTVKEEPIDKWDHAMNCFEYFAHSSPEYVPPASAVPLSAAHVEFLNWRKRELQGNAVGSGPLGGSQSYSFGPGEAQPQSGINVIGVM